MQDKKLKDANLAKAAQATDSNNISQVLTPADYENGKFIHFSNWTESNFFDPTSVNMFGRTWDYTGAKLLKLHPIQRRITEHVLTPNAKGIFPYETVVYSTIKKEGKTTLAGAVGAWWSACIEPTNLVLCLANDQEQSAGRIFGAMLPTLEALGCRVPKAPSSKPEIRLPNGSIIQAIANNYAGNAGANYGLTLWSELWAYASERSRRLWDELVPVPTRKNSLRWVETYVGFEDESELLLHLFNRIFKKTDEKELQDKAKPVPELIDIQSEGKPCCYHIPEEGLFYFHNHSPFMGPTFSGVDEYQLFRNRQKADLRPAQYIRLWENRWQQAEGNFIHPEEYDEACTLTGPSEEPSVFAGDASQRNDTTVLVGTKKYERVLWGEIQTRYKLTYVSVWDPKTFGAKRRNELGQSIGDIDLQETIAAEVYRLYICGLMIGPFRYDPMQMHQVAINLRKLGVPCVEFSQQTERLKADTNFGNLLRKGLIDLFDNPILGQHIKNAKVKEYDNQQVRIVKGTHSRSNKVDGAVALSMSLYAAEIYRPQQEEGYSSSSRSMR